MKKLFMLSSLLLINQIQATVIVTHGLGTTGIAFYQNSSYIQKIAESAQLMGHQVKCIPWLASYNPHKEYAGLLPQERIIGAVAIAKAIIDECAQKNQIILIGHSYGGHIMNCATRLLNPANKELTDSFICELITIIKKMTNQNQTRGFSPKVVLNTLFTGWQLSQVIISAIEKTDIINKNIIEFIKQHLSLSYLEEIKKAWDTAFNEVQSYKKIKGISHINNIKIVYTIGTTFSGDSIFIPDMQIVDHHINLYSIDDFMPALFGNQCAPLHERTSNLSVFIDPSKSYAPTHHNFCGNIVMAPWILLIPENLKAKKIGNFQNFQWGISGSITFHEQQPPTYIAYPTS